MSEFHRGERRVDLLKTVNMRSKIDRRKIENKRPFEEHHKNGNYIYEEILLVFVLFFFEIYYIFSKLKRPN